MASVDQAAAPQSSVFQLFTPSLLPATLMLGGGVTLYAVESYITATVAPSIVRDIGGLALLAWVTTLFVAAAVLGSIFVAMRPRGMGLRGAYVCGALIFATGSLLCAAAPVMEAVLAGRAIQGSVLASSQRLPTPSSASPIRSRCGRKPRRFMPRSGVLRPCWAPAQAACFRKEARGDTPSSSSCRSAC